MLCFVVINSVLFKLSHRAQELCKSRGGRPGLPGPNKPCGFRGRKATSKQNNNSLCVWMSRYSVLQAYRDTNLKLNEAQSARRVPCIYPHAM